MAWHRRSVIPVGRNVFLTADVRATGYLGDPRVVWRASAPLVIRVDESGLANALGPGAATADAIARADTTKRGAATMRAEGPPGT